MIRFIDLFAGLGGLRLGFTEGLKEVGIDSTCVFSSEIKDYAIKVYKNYFNDAKVYGDICNIKTSDIPDFDFLLAGFPCQPFSSAGKGLGFLDTRGTLFFEIERILKDKIDSNKAPIGFLLENVEGLINHDNGNTLDTIITKLEKLGYNVTYKLLDSRDFGLAQSRKRVYIVGLLNSTISLDNFLKKTAKLKDILETGLPTNNTKFTNLLLKHYSTYELYGKSVKDKRGGNNNIHSWDIELKGKTSIKERELLNILLKERRKKHWANEIGIKWMDGMPLTENQIRTFYNDKELSNMLHHLTVEGYLTYEFPKEFINGKREPDITKEKGYNIVAGKLSFEFSKILDPNDLAPTLVAMDVTKLGVIDGNGIRHLSIREAQKLFGYPDSYDLSIIKESDAFDLLGNTVCVPVIEKISVRIGNKIKELQNDINS